MHKPNHKQVNETTTKHLDMCKKEPVEEPVSEQEQVSLQLENFNVRWDALSADVKEYSTQVENTEPEVEKINEKERVLEDLFREVEKVLDDQKPVQTNPTKCAANLDEIKELITKVESKEDDLKEFNKAVENTNSLMNQYSGDKDNLDRHHTDTNDKFRKIRTRLSERTAELEEVQQKAQTLDSDLTDILGKVTETDKEFKPKIEKPVPKDPKKVEEAIKEVDKALDDLSKKSDDLQKDYAIGDWFIEKSKQEPLVVHDVEKRLKDVQDPVDDVLKKLNDYKAKLVTSQHEQQALEEKLDNLDSSLNSLEEQVNDLKPVSAKFTVARSQQETFKVCIFFHLYTVKYRFSLVSIL